MNQANRENPIAQQRANSNAQAFEARSVRELIEPEQTHSLIIGYVLWIFGFLGSHRFYFGKPKSGVLYFLTFGLLGIGWLVDLFLMPKLYASANNRFLAGPVSYNISYILLTFFGVFGLHRFYRGRFITGLVYLLTGGLFLLGVLYDFLYLNHQVADRNRELRAQ